MFVRVVRECFDLTRLYESLRVRKRKEKLKSGSRLLKRFHDLGGFSKSAHMINGSGTDEQVLRMEVFIAKQSSYAIFDQDEKAVEVLFEPWKFVFNPNSNYSNTSSLITRMNSPGED